MLVTLMCQFLKDASNNTLAKYALFYVCYPSTNLLKVIKKIERMDQHPLRASVLQLRYIMLGWARKRKSGTGEGLTEDREEGTDAAGEERQLMSLTPQTDFPVRKSAAHTMPSF